VPIYWNATEDELFDIFKNINGIIFPGGSTNIMIHDKTYSISQRRYSGSRDSGRRQSRRRHSW